MPVPDLDDEEMPLEERVYHLRVGGLSLVAVARELGISRMEAGRLFQQFMVELTKVTQSEDREITKQLELDRLDRLHDAYWQAATQEHDAMVTIGKGADAYSEMIRVAPDKDAAKLVLDISKQRSRLTQIDQLSPTDSQVVAQVLIVGNDQAAFLEALRAGREPAQLTSGHPDNGVVEGTVEAELEVS